MTPAVLRANLADWSNLTNSERSATLAYLDRILREWITQEVRIRELERRLEEKADASRSISVR
jgi:hypothetical protein